MLPFGQLLLGDLGKNTEMASPNRSVDSTTVDAVMASVAATRAFAIRRFGYKLGPVDLPLHRACNLGVSSSAASVTAQLGTDVVLTCSAFRPEGTSSWGRSTRDPETLANTSNTAHGMSLDRRQRPPRRIRRRELQVRWPQR